MNLLKKVRIEIAVSSEAYVQETIDAIIAGSRTGEIGDGKIFVLPIEHCIRIRNGDIAATRLARIVLAEVDPSSFARKNSKGRAASLKGRG